MSIDKVRDQMYLEFAIKILDFIRQDEIDNPGAIDRLKVFYAKVQEAQLQDIILDFLNNHEVRYSISYNPNEKLHTVFFRADHWNNMFDIKVTNENLTDALVDGSIKSYDRIVLLNEIPLSIDNHYGFYGVNE